MNMGVTTAYATYLYSQCTLLQFCIIGWLYISPGPRRLLARLKFFFFNKWYVKDDGAINARFRGLNVHAHTLCK